ncbi:MAG TPA: indolepyruvate ferredoxin oxidoreductase family protein [Burkholderiales bacterium]|nr:indolepyruvate ferredoxin oxidoreductase family protein [Burkholderiales bacterium]
MIVVDASTSAPTEARMTLRTVSLDDKYTLQSGRIFITGTQALVRLPLMQHLRDRAERFHTGGYVSGYRGSPLGGYDQQLWAAKKHLEAHHIVFNPGVNEDLAATACWGTQQLGFHGASDYAGVFAIWYGKGPGVDRTGDVFRHGNLAGSHPRGGVLVLMGDDHTCESSTTAHQSEYAMVDAMIPVLNPAGVQELLDYGICGWALSRYAGVWVGLKCVKDVIDASGTVDVGPERVRVVTPTDFRMPPGGLNIRWPDQFLEQELRLHRYKLEAARAFARANGLDRLILDAPHAKLGVITCGKSYLDVRQALQYLGIDEAEANRLGLRLYKVGMTFPLEPQGAMAFAQGLERIIVVEEKRSLIEWQLKEALYGQPNAPRIIGKQDERGALLFPSNGALDPNHIAVEIGRRILERISDAQLQQRVKEQEQLESRVVEKPSMDRTPYFCSGCPHSTGTRLPEGSIALSGIGCHFLAQYMNRNTAGFTQMGGEGASWIGEAPFVKTRHVFQNVGDGTYFHSGFLAVRAAIAAGVNVTFKILYNDAVAMTGGQHIDGNLAPPQITRELLAEGVKQVAVVTDEPHKYAAGAFPPEVQVHHRDDYDKVQRAIREIAGTTAIIYDQTCASEKRRRRKRNAFPDPAKRAFINDLVCEGCGDCGVQSNCVSIVPQETEFGRKRRIDQSSCNKDYSCVKGFCPSFVTVHGGGLRKGKGAAAGADAANLPFAVLPEPALPAIDRPYGIMVTGVGGTGVVTIGAILGMAAHLEDKGFSSLDMAGLAQKGGAVLAHLQIAETPQDIKTVRLGSGGAQLLLGCDLVVSASEKAMDTTRAGVTHALVNTHQQMTGDFTRNPDFAFPAQSLKHTIVKGVGEANAEFVEATRVATALMGDSIATNMFILGFAYQRGLVPVSAQAIERAIELNGAAVRMNQAAFLWGRRMAVDPATVERMLAPRETTAPMCISESLDEMSQRRGEFLTAYQNATYAQKYAALVERVRKEEQLRARGLTGLAEAVARYYFKLLAYKDEYEVARLYTDPAFMEKVKAQFEGDYSLHFHLAPPLLAKRNDKGELVKREYGAWMFGAFKLLAKLRFLRGTALDVFGYSEERRTERKLIADYEKTVDQLLAQLTPDNHGLAVQIASIPEEIRGFGHVKAWHLAAARQKEAKLLETWRAPTKARAAA